MSDCKPKYSGDTRAPVVIRLFNPKYSEDSLHTGGIMTLPSCGGERAACNAGHSSCGGDRVGGCISRTPTFRSSTGSSYCRGVWVRFSTFHLIGASLSLTNWQIYERVSTLNKTLPSQHF